MTAELREAVARLRTDSGGTFELIIIRPGDLRRLCVDAALGSEDAARLATMALRAVENVVSAPRKKPALCGCCPRAVRKRNRYAIGLALPWTDGPAHGIAFVLCEKCAADSDLLARGIAAMKRIWPDARPVTLTHPAGGQA